MTAALERGEWSAARPGTTLLPGKTRYPFYRRLGRPQGRSGRAEYTVINSENKPKKFPSKEVNSFRLGFSIRKENVSVHKNFPHHAVSLISIMLLMFGTYHMLILYEYHACTLVNKE